MLHKENTRFLDTGTITRREFLYPHGQDKRTVTLNNIFSKVILGEVNIPKSFVGEFKCEVPNKKYNFVLSVPNKYNNSEILWEITYSLVEQSMKWLDLSEFDNFEIKVDDGGIVNKCTYYDLAHWGLNRISSPLIIPVTYSEDKLKKINNWVSAKFELERKEWENKFTPDALITPKKPKKINKLINKIKEYANISF